MKKTVLITGGAINLGAAISTLFAQNGYNVVINYNKSKKEALKLQNDLVKKYHIKAKAIKADISQEEEVKAMLESILKEFKVIDVLVNNAAYYKDCEMMKKETKDLKRVLEVNVIGTFLVSKYVSKNMLKNKQGHIINISSTNAIDTLNPYSFDYDASKAAIISLTHNLAYELAPFIRVNAVAPGWINTKPVLEMNPHIIKEEQEKILLKRFANVEEIANVILFLASDKSSYINNSIIRVDGGIR